jgi:hypothetical protein
MLTDCNIKKHLNLEWFFMKLSIVLTVVPYLIYCIFKYNTILEPSGICQCVSCDIIAFYSFKSFLTCLLLVCSLFYLSEKYMLITIPMLSLISVFVLTIEEANGNPAESGLISLVFISQSIAYFLQTCGANFSLFKNRLQFPVQMVASAYLLAGISKVLNSGYGWFTEYGLNFVLEINRVYYVLYSASGDIKYIDIGSFWRHFFTNHLLVLKGLLFFSLAIELFSFVILFGKKWAYYYGFALLLLHFGIYLMMGISFPTIMVPMIIILMNPLWKIYTITKRQIV